MNPIDPGEDKGRLVVFGGGQAEYVPLPARVVRDNEEWGDVLTKWQLTTDERAAILDGACIYLNVMTFNRPLQPIALWIEGTEHDPYRPQLEADDEQS